MGSDRACHSRDAISSLFDYMAEAVISKTTGDPGITKLVESFANMGAPWLSGISDIGRLAYAHGFSLFENFQTAELFRTYRPDA